MGVCRDITERTAAEQALRESNRKLEEAQRLAHIGYWERDLDTNRISWSDETFRIFGLPPQQRTLSVAELEAFVHPEDRPKVILALARALHGGPNYDVEYRLVRPDGEVRTVHSRADTAWASSGRPHRIFGTVQDITERKLVESALRESHDLLNAVAEGTSVTFFVKDRRGRYLLLNSVGARILGKSAEEILGKDDREFLPPDIAQALMEHDRAVMSTGERQTTEEIVPSNGMLRTFMTTKAPYRDSQGRIIGLIGISRDITELKKADEEQRRQARLNEAIFHQAISCLMLVDRNFRFIRVNAAVAKNYRKKAEDFPGRSYFELFPHERDDALGPLEQVLRTRKPVQASAVPYAFPDQPERGTTYWDSIVQPILDERGEVEVLFCSSIDVTERKRAEEARRESEQRYREVFNYTSDCIFLLDVTPDGRFRFVELNPADEKMIGYSSAEVAGKLVEEAFPGETAAVVNANYRRCVEAGTPLSYEEELDLPVGRKSFQTSLVPVRDDAGRIHRIVGVARDITESRRAEVQLRGSLREKDVLLKEVHHRVKNNLQLISSLLALQAGRIKDRAVEDAFTESQNRLRAMALAHENLYRSGDLASIRVAGHIEALCSYLYRSYSVDPDRIALDLHALDVTLDLDRSVRCGLIINELVSNAIKHAFPGGRAGRVTVRLDALPDGCYSLLVADDGVGLPPGLEPTRAESLGLQLAFDMAEQLGGILSVEREGGTRFTLRFPGDDGRP